MSRPSPLYVPVALLLALALIAALRVQGGQTPDSPLPYGREQSAPNRSSTTISDASSVATSTLRVPGAGPLDGDERGSGAPVAESTTAPPDMSELLFEQMKPHSQALELGRGLVPGSGQSWRMWVYLEEKRSQPCLAIGLARPVPEGGSHATLGGSCSQEPPVDASGRPLEGGHWVFYGQVPSETALIQVTGPSGTEVLDPLDRVQFDRSYLIWFGNGPLTEVKAFDSEGDVLGVKKIAVYAPSDGR